MICDFCNEEKSDVRARPGFYGKSICDECSIAFSETCDCGREVEDFDGDEEPPEGDGS